jgi:glyoxylase-like metal-dependent hydrolase (beta-lactamase superfamily II)
MPRIIPISLGITKAFLVKAEGAMLIDTGCPGDENRIEAALQKENVALSDLRLILHTHGHYDHCGSTRRLKERTAAPVAIHHKDVHLIQSGMPCPLRPITWGSHLVRLISYRSFLPVVPDLVIEQEMDLGGFGIPGRVIFTPGHTAGSISVLLEGGQAIAGDLMVGGYLGGYLFPRRPGYHYFADDVAGVRESIKKLMDKGATTVFVAHGGPFERHTILARF